MDHGADTFHDLPHEPPLEEQPHHKDRRGEESHRPDHGVPGLFEDVHGNAGEINAYGLSVRAGKRVVCRDVGYAENVRPPLEPLPSKYFRGDGGIELRPHDPLSVLDDGGHEPGVTGEDGHLGVEKLLHLVDEGLPGEGEPGGHNADDLP